MKTGYGNIAKMTIDRRDLSITLGESRYDFLTADVYT